VSAPSSAMIVLSWNCRGLRNLRIVQSLRHLVKTKRPNLVFLMETKIMQGKADAIRIKLGFDHCFVVDCHGKSGGVMVLWKNSSLVEIQNFSRRHINAVIRGTTDSSQWKLKGFYGHPETAKRGDSWVLFRYLAKLDPVPWLCLGDFNEITSAAEKTSQAIRPLTQMRAF